MKNYELLEKTLGFKPKQEGLYWVSPIVLTSSNKFVVYAYQKEENLIFFDNGQILDLYDDPNINQTEVKKLAKQKAKQFDLKIAQNSITKCINPKNIVGELSEYLKAIIILEDFIKNNI